MSPWISFTLTNYVPLPQLLCVFRSPHLPFPSGRLGPLGWAQIAGNTWGFISHQPQTKLSLKTSGWWSRKVKVPCFQVEHSRVSHRISIKASLHRILSSITPGLTSLSCPASATPLQVLLGSLSEQIACRGGIKLVLTVMVCVAAFHHQGAASSHWMQRKLVPG